MRSQDPSSGDVPQTNMLGSNMENMEKNVWKNTKSRDLCQVGFLYSDTQNSLRGRMLAFVPPATCHSQSPGWSANTKPSNSSNHPVGCPVQVYPTVYEGLIRITWMVYRTSTAWWFNKVCNSLKPPNCMAYKGLQGSMAQHLGVIPRWDKQPNKGRMFTINDVYRQNQPKIEE